LNSDAHFIHVSYSPLTFLDFTMYTFRTLYRFAILHVANKVRVHNYISKKWIRELNQLLLDTLQEEISQHFNGQADEDSRLSQDGVWQLQTGRFSAHWRSRRFLRQSQLFWITVGRFIWERSHYVLHHDVRMSVPYRL